MAEEQQPQGNIIGKLFVELGAKGLPSLLKGLNTVAASFLLTKNAAEQLMRPIINTGKQAANSAVGVAKLSASLGTTLLEAQKFQLYFQKHNLSESLLGDLASTADMLTRVQMGIGGIDDKFAYTMNELRLNWWAYDGSIESMERLMQDVNERTKNMDANRRRVHLQNLGWSPEWLYAFERGVNLSDARALSDKEVMDWVKSSEAINETKQTIGQVIRKSGSKVAPSITKGANIITDTIDKAQDGDKKSQLQNRGFWGSVGLGAATGGGVGSFFGGAGALIGAPIGAIGGIVAGVKALEIGNKLGTPTGGAAPIPALEDTDFRPNLSNANTTININNENRVTVSNPQDAGRAISSINQQTLTNIEYSQFQASNRPGL